MTGRFHGGGRHGRLVLALLLAAIAAPAAAQSGLTPEEIRERWRAQAGVSESGDGAGEGMRTRGLSIETGTREAPEAVPEAPPEYDPEMTVDLKITFRTGSAEIRPGEQRDLRALCTAMRDAEPGLRFNIIGHADAAGPEDLNRRLSEARGRAVAGWLEGECGIAPGRFAVFGLGESRLLPGVPAVSEANRRVEVSLRRK